MNIFKHIKAITLCVCLIILTACGSNIEPVNDSVDINDGTHSVTSSAIQGDNTGNSSDGSETVTVLAKSNNTVSDKEKQEVLDQLSTEMDGLLNTINEVEAESIQDSELSF